MNLKVRAVNHTDKAGKMRLSHIGESQQYLLPARRSEYLLKFQFKNLFERMDKESL
jgi:hypothetical protein